MIREEKDFLSTYNIKDFDVPLCSVDIAILAVEEGELKVLLVERQAHPHRGRWALPGGFADLKNDKTIEDTCLLYTSPSPRDLSTSRMPSSA